MSIKSTVCAVALCLASGAALAQPAPLPPGAVAGLAPVMPVQEIGKILRAKGFAPQATPVRNGEAYQVRAIDRYGRQVRVAIDARYGDILMVRPIAMMAPGAYGPRPYGAPGYHDDEPPTGAIGAYPPPPGAGPPRSAALTPAHPPVPRPKPVAKPAAVSPAPAAPEAAPAASSPPSTATAPAESTPSAAPATPPAGDKGSMPPVAPLE